MAEVIVAPINNQENYYKVINDNLDKRILILNTDISDANVEDYIMHIINWNMEDINTPIEDRKPITIYINSCGGDVFIGLLFCSIIEQSKTPIRTVCLGMAASCGYHIFINGHQRYAFKNSTFLQHDGSISVSDSASKARDFMRFNDEMEERCKENILSHTKIAEDQYEKAYDREWWMFADEAKRLGVVDFIIGEDKQLEDIF